MCGGNFVRRAFGEEVVGRMLRLRRKVSTGSPGRFSFPVVKHHWGDVCETLAHRHAAEGSCKARQAYPFLLSAREEGI